MPGLNGDHRISRNIAADRDAQRLPGEERHRATKTRRWRDGANLLAAHRLPFTLCGAGLYNEWLRGGFSSGFSSGKIREPWSWRENRKWAVCPFFFGASGSLWQIWSN